MKLNLLPTSVSREKGARGALLFGILLFIVCVLAAGWLYTTADKDLAESQTDIGAKRGQAQLAKDTADQADVVIQQATGLLRNAGLAKAMLEHNKQYPDLYDTVQRGIPSFYRVSSMSAAPSGPDQATVTLVGVLDTYQQYADLMLAILRIKGVSSVSRAGFQNDMPFVPAPTAEDQYGKPHKPGETPIPDDPLKRLDYYQAQGRITGYTGTGGFGSGQPGVRGPMPNASLVTVQFVIAWKLQTPDPAATLKPNGGGGAGPGGPPAGGPSGPAGPVGKGRGGAVGAGGD